MSRLFPVLPIILLVLSCGNSKSEMLRENLFKLKYGKMDDELDFTVHYGYPFNENTYMRAVDGLFYISHGTLNKVLVFNSYGDLLNLVYDPILNPSPALLSAVSQTVQGNTRSIPYMFGSMGHIAVTKQKDFFVEDNFRYPVSQDELGYVRHFSRTGDFIKSIGIGGMGGTPFPHIKDIYTNESGELIVVVYELSLWRVFWFDNNGDQLFTIILDEKSIPADDTPDSIRVIKEIFPDPQVKRIFIKVDSYTAARGENKNQFLQGNIHGFDCVTQSFYSVVPVPKDVLKYPVAGTYASREYEVSYTFLGVVAGGYFFLYGITEENDIRVCIVDSNGTIVLRDKLGLNDEDRIFEKFTVSPEGILCAMVVGEFDITVCWWRTDLIIKGLSDADRNGR